MTSPVAGISSGDRALLAELRKRLQKELKLCPQFDDDYSLMRWLIGWDRNLDTILPRIVTSIRTCNTLGLNKREMNTIEKVTRACDNCHEAVPYMPGSLLGFDKQDDLVFLHAIGDFNAGELLRCAKFSDLYIINILGSYGMLEIIREKEKEVKRLLGTVIIFDLEGLGYFQLATLSQFNSIAKTMQEMFPDIVKKLYIINAPVFINLLLKMILPVLAKQTRDKLHVLGSNYKEVLCEELGESVLFEHWGGTRKAETKYGFLRRGKRLPEKMLYNKANEPDIDSLTKLTISTKLATFIPIKVEGHVVGRKLCWWWKLDSKDVLFTVLKAAPGREYVAEHPDDYLCWPKFRIQTDYVPEWGEIPAEEPGIYKFVFENDGYLWSKTVRYLIEVRT